MPVLFRIAKPTITKRLCGCVWASTLLEKLLFSVKKMDVMFIEGNKESLMGKITKWIGVLVFCFTSSQAVATEMYDGYSQGYGDGYIATSSGKFVTGLGNAATGFLELPKNIVLTTQEDNIAYGMTTGLVSGIMHTVGRTVIGVFDVATFWIPTPPSIQPGFIWEDFSTESSY